MTIFQYEPNEADVSGERNKQLQILDRLSSKKSVLNENLLAGSQQSNQQQLVLIQTFQKGNDSSNISFDILQISIIMTVDN